MAESQVRDHASGIFFGIHRLANGIKNKEKIIGRDGWAELGGLGQNFQFVRLHIVPGEQAFLLGECAPSLIGPTPRPCLSPE